MLMRQRTRLLVARHLPCDRSGWLTIGKLAADAYGIIS
jgi:hypothetical protein